MRIVSFLGETDDFFYLGALNSLFLFKFTVFKLVVFHIFDQITDSYAVQILGALAYWEYRSNKYKLQGGSRGEDHSNQESVEKYYY